MERVSVEVLQSQYEKLLEERTAFQGAGMDAKVAEWDHKIAVCEASMQYPKTSFAELAENLGIHGLNKVLEQRKAFFQSQRSEALKIAHDVVDEVLGGARKISESKLWSLISANEYRFAKNPLAKVEALALIKDKLVNKTLTSILDASLTEARKKCKTPEVPANLQAYVKIVELENYTADDNPPMEVLKAIAVAKESKRFSAMFVAYPMIGEVKQIDPIVFGVIQEPNKSYANLSHVRTIWFDGDAPLEYMSRLDFGDMFQIAEWV